jgi:hypothetical protein
VVNSNGVKTLKGNVMQVGLPETPTEELPTLAELAEAGGLDEVSSFKVKRGPDPEGEE